MDTIKIETKTEMIPFRIGMGDILIVDGINRGKVVFINDDIRMNADTYNLYEFTDGSYLYVDDMEDETKSIYFYERDYAGELIDKERKLRAEKSISHEKEKIFNSYFMLKRKNNKRS